MRIGILTFHNVPNYGAALQAFALKSYLSSLGNRVQVIDFQCPGNSDEFTPQNRKRVFTASGNPAKRLVKTVLYNRYAAGDYQKKYERFWSFFRKHYDLETDTHDMFNGFDAVFCGSDQIWNPAITGGFRREYFGGDGTGKAVVASYAASCGDISEFSPETKEEFFGLCKSVKHVGVREESVYRTLTAQNIPCQCTVDPTFLLPAQTYIDRLELKKTDGPGYLLQYSLQKSKALDEVAQRIAEEKGLKIINLCGYIGMEAKGDRIFDAGPEQFLQYLYNARYVVTNSFHGVALSLIFQKDFTSCLPASRKGRISDLLQALSLQERICQDQLPICTGAIDYDRVGRELDQMIGQSKAFINQVLENKNE